MNVHPKMYELIIEYRLGVVNISVTTMVKQGPSLLFIIVSVLASRNRSQHSHDLTNNDSYSVDTHTLFDDGAAPVVDPGLNEDDQKSGQFVQPRGCETFLFVSESGTLMWQDYKHRMLYIDSRRKGRLKRKTRLLTRHKRDCRVSKISRYKHVTFLDSVCQEYLASIINNRPNECGFGYHGILQLMAVIKGTMPYETFESRHFCFTEGMRCEYCDTRSEYLHIASCRWIHSFVLFQYRLYFTFIYNTAMFSYLIYIHSQLTPSPKVIDHLLCFLRSITTTTIFYTVHIIVTCFKLGRKYCKEDLSFISSDSSSIVHKFDFLDLFSHILNPPFQTYPKSFPQNILAFPLIGSLNDYLTRAQKGQLSEEEEMCYEVRRLQSFNGVLIPQSRIKLARTGFFATGSEDETRCYSCGATHRKWEMQDQPNQVHKKLSPGCPHLTSGDPRNIPVLSPSEEPTDSVVGVLQTYPVTTEPLNTSGETSQHASAPDASQATSAAGSQASSRLDISTAVYPQFKDTQSRLDSYREWRYSHIQDPQSLTRAGFYYAGYRDCVRCFYCGVGLKTWEEQDDPWVMHVRWRSSCDYVREIRGQQFIEQALGQNVPTTTTTTNTTATAGHSLPASDHQSSNSQPVHASQDTTDAFGRAVEMGFEREAIETAMSELHTSPSGAFGLSGGVSLEQLVERLVLTTSSTSTGVSRDESSQTSNTAGGGGPGGESKAATSLIHLASEPFSGDSMTRAKHIIDTQDSDQPRVNSPADTRVISRADIRVSSLVEPRVISPDEERRLAEENESLREESTCKICMDNPSCIVFLPCGHLVTCAECAPALRKCPICRSYIRGSVRVHTTRRQ